MKQIIIAALALCAIAINSYAQQPAARQKNFNLNKSVAISSYDPVSYFHKKPVKGSANLAYTYAGITYYFANTADMNLFKNNPAAYEPQYGGWCAYAMGSKGQKVEVDPETYKIVNGKLYLFYNRLFNNTLTSWNKDETALKAKADANWQKIYR